MSSGAKMQRVVRQYKKPFILTAAAIAAIAFFLLYNSYLNYAQLAISQLDTTNPALRFPEFTFQEVTEQDLENNPKLKVAIGEVGSKYARFIRQDCQPKDIVMCDVSHNTEYTINLTPQEYQSMIDSFDFEPVQTGSQTSSPSSSSDIVGGFLKYDCSDYYSSLGANLDYCYYTVTMTRNS